MRGKILRRTVWCRQSDFENRLQSDAIRTGYTRADWNILSIAELQKRAMWQVLRGEKLGDDIFFSDRDRRDGLDYNKLFLATMSETEKFARHYVEYVRANLFLYSNNWRKWSWQYSNDNIRIRYRCDRPWEPLGIATLERHY